MTDRRPDRVGGNKPALHRERAYQLLADGGWHSYYKVLTSVAAVVNPSLAYRHAIRNRKTPAPTDTESRRRIIRSGQRDIARSALSRKDRFERRVSDDGERQIRLLPVRKPTPEQQSISSKKGWANRRATGRD